MVKKRSSDSPELGRKFGRPDIERIGLFGEMPYISAKAARKTKAQREPGNMLCGGRKIKDGTQIGYFEPVFKRIFSKEALRGRGRKPPPPRFKNVSERPFVPPSGPKLHSSPGDYYGTFSGIVEAFGTKRRPQPPRKPEGRNLMSSPAKKGGPGYADIGLSRYPEHKPDRYGLKPKYKEYGKILGRPMINAHFPQPYFDKNPYPDPPNVKPGRIYVPPKEKPFAAIHPGYILPTGKGKLQGGCHDGCFDKWPEHKPDGYGKRPKHVSEKAFYPLPSDVKSYYNTSILHQRVDLRLNSTNYRVYQPDYVQYIAVE